MELKKRVAGVLLHVTSLPGPHGIGDFGPSAYHFVDWLKIAGQSVWQWLPTTPIGPANSPYQSVSAFAGSPLMVALEPFVDKGWLSDVALPYNDFESSRVDFERVVPWRMTQLRKAASAFFNIGIAEDRLAYDAWTERENYWLEDYALFMALENAQLGRPWWEWGKALAGREPASLDAARIAHAEEINFWKFVQWGFDTQLSLLKSYANKNGVSIVGDLPIFVAHHSADCWTRPDLYYLDDEFQPTVVAGVPPDDMGPLGQRWGNPLYKWDRMASENFSWWTDRVKRALKQADIFRVDHFRGFAGYWEIPSKSPSAKEGRWVRGPGRELFDAIERALGKLPLIAEDLGLITPDVIELRDECGFPGMKILQFGFGTDGHHEFLPHNYSVETIAYTGTHDNDTVQGWWANTTNRERKFAGTYLACNQHDVHWAMIRAICNSVSIMAIYPLQDVLGLDSKHRMNLPGTTTNNWEWRFDWGMVGSEAAQTLALISATSGRGPIGPLN